MGTRLEVGKSATHSASAGAWLEHDESSQQPFTRWALPVAILAATFLTYLGTVDLGFVFDDQALIITNDSIRSWSYLPTYFASHIWSFHYPHLLANFYRPLFLVWLRANDALFGLHPWGWHLTSALAHVAVTYLVYRLALHLTKDGWLAGVAALAFGLHPVHAEAVADITSIQEPLSTFFILAALLAFCEKWESGRSWSLASLVLAAAALLSKESAMMLPVLVALYAWIYPRAEPEASGHAVLDPLRLRSAFRASLPFWGLMLIYVPVRVWALRGFAHVVTPLPPATQVYTMPSVMVFYLRLLVWPVGLSCYYDTPYVSSPAWRDFVLPTAILIALAAGLAYWHWRTRRRSPDEAHAIEFAALWMILTLVPVLNFRFFPAGEVAHDRYVYLPSVGLVLLLAIALRQVLRAAPSRLRRPAWVLLALAALALAGATVRQTLFWSDDLTLSVRSHAIAPHNLYATSSLGAAVAARGMDGAAIALYQEALAIDPSFWPANRNLAYLYFAHGNYPEAAHFFAQSCAAGPQDGDQFLFLGLALLHTGRLSEAEKALRTALALRPFGKNYHLGLAMILKQEGNLAAAKEELEKELAADPQNDHARTALADVTKELQSPAPPRVEE